jgi:chorismate-pyruvate lyase
MQDMRNPGANSEAGAFAARAVYAETYPLDEFYRERGEILPPIGRVKPDEIPDPYKKLLVHNGDMTSRLEAFHGDKIHIQLLARHTHENEYFREVVLTLNGEKKPVEFGAIKIVLDLFPLDAQKEILKEHRPLGEILKNFNIAHSSRPKTFLSVLSDDFINRALKLSDSHSLYGRRNTLVDSWDRPLAEIVEILPP